MIRVFHGFSEADAADAAEDRSMTPEQRVAMVFELRERLLTPMQLSKDLREFIELLNSNRVEYLVVGAFAVAWHGYARFTADIDFLVRTRSPDCGTGGEGTQRLRIREPRNFAGRPDASRPHRSARVKPNRIDLITSIAGVTFEEAWESRVAGTLDGLPVAYIGATFSFAIRNPPDGGRISGTRNGCGSARR